LNEQEGALGMDRKQQLAVEDTVMGFLVPYGAGNLLG
jgi:hypothetical protein